MKSATDLIQRDLLAARELHGALASPLTAFHKQIAMTGVGLPGGVIQHVIDGLRQDDAFRRSLFVGNSAIQNVGQMARIWADEKRWLSAMAIPPIFELAQRAAELATSFQLPKVLHDYRTPSFDLAARLTSTHAAELWHRPEYLSAFNQASAMANLYAKSVGVNQAILDANRVMMLDVVRGVGSLAEYRTLLDAAGLTLPRWPRVRLLTHAEKRRRLRLKLKRNAEPPHIKLAKSLVHRYELTMRDILDSAMADTYGENWAEERLPLCDCKDLLGKWKSRGGEVLDHADYAHYARIVRHPEHFEALFQFGFDNAQDAYNLLVKAGRLRANSHHARDFTSEDLRDLRLTWRTIEAGLLALMSGFTVEAQ